MRWFNFMFALISISVGGVLPIRAQSAGDLLAFVSYAHYDSTNQNGVVQVYDFAMNTLTPVTDIPLKVVSSLAWSGDRRLAFVGMRDFYDYAVYVWDGDLHVIAENEDGYGSLTWSSDGRLAFVTVDGENRFINLWQDDMITPLCSTPVGCDSPAWSADSRLAYILYPQGVTPAFQCGDCSPVPTPLPSGIVVGGSAGVVTITAPRNGSGSAPIWLPDGRLAFTNAGQLMAWDESTISTVRSVGSGYFVWDYGNLAIVSSPYGAGMVNLAAWRDVLDPQSNPVSLVEDAGYVKDVTWSADGHLAFDASTSDGYPLYVWDGQDLITVTADGVYNGSSPAWSADGRLAFVSAVGMHYDIYLWDGHESSLLVELPNTDETDPVWWLPPA